MAERAQGLRPGSEYVRIGHVGKSHGYGGGLYLETASFPGVLAAGLELWIDGDTFAVASVGGTPARPLVQLTGVGDREAARGLAGKAVWAEREALPALGADEWYASDLEGMRVEGDDGQRIGIVRAMVCAPSIDVLEVELDNGGDLLVPIGDDALRAVDLDKRVVTVDRFFLGLGPGADDVEQ